MYHDIFTEQRLAKIRQEELIAQGQQSARNRWAERETPARKIRSVPVLARVLVMLGR